jgi:predicted DNA-binding protein with PD1-like motif
MSSGTRLPTVFPRDTPSNWPTFVDMAQVDVMGQLGYGTFFLGAHDRGARVAHRMCLDHPDAVRKVCVMDIVPTLTMYRDSRESRKYEPSVTLGEQVELLSLIGDVALYESKPVVHAHAVVGKKDGTAHGGHLLEAHIRPTCEVVLTESPAHLQKYVDSESGLALIGLAEARKASRAS